MLIVCTEYQAWKIMAEGTGSGYVRVRAREPSQSWDWDASSLDFWWQELVANGNVPFREPCRGNHGYYQLQYQVLHKSVAVRTASMTINTCTSSTAAVFFIQERHYDCKRVPGTWYQVVSYALEI